MSTFPEAAGPHAGAVRRCLDRIAACPDMAGVALLARRDKDAMAEALLRDALAALTGAQGPLAGRVLCVKACFDVRGWVTHAGSRVLADAPPAREDGGAVAALRAAGAVLLAQTNMTEFAYGALGLNPWYGTPLTPLDPGARRVAGGSSSGGAVAVAGAMADLALVSDTSGSARIPAAFCGVAGFKPSQGRYDGRGMMRLAPSFDVPGVIAPDAQGCLLADLALAPREAADRAAHGGVRGRRYVVPRHVEALLDAAVGEAFEQWLRRLREAGAQVRRAALPSVRLAGEIARDGGMIAAEAYALHAGRLAAGAAGYDPRVGPRILLGAQASAHRYAAARLRLRELRAQFDRELDDAEAVLTPTVPMLPPRLADLDDDAAYLRENARAFSLTEFANRLDLPSISLPDAGGARLPAGLLVTGRRLRDRALLHGALAVQAALGDAVS